MSKEEGELTHIREDGSAEMVDVSNKEVSLREAVATARIRLKSSTIEAITEGEVPKGDTLAVARIAGIQAAKRTSELIPLCHQLPLSKVTIDFEIESEAIGITCLVRTEAKTGVEMEALTGASVSSLTIYDMCKAIDKTMVVESISLKKKTKSEI